MYVYIINTYSKYQTYSNLAQKTIHEQYGEKVNPINDPKAYRDI